MEEVEKTIDIAREIRKSDSSFYKSLPGYVIKLLEKIICQDEINSAIYRNRHLQGLHFINGILDLWNVKVNARGIENLPSEGRFILASNHPVGGMDALSFFNTAGRYYPDIISPANQILYLIPNLKELMLGINVFGRQTKETAAKLHSLFESDRQIFIFPAGEVSRRKNGKISDIVWQKSFITKAIEHKRDIIPVHISGRNSNMFYFIGNLRKFLGIRMYIETMLLPREMIKQRGKQMTVTFGKPISYKTFTSEMTHAEWAQKVKAMVYSLPDQNK